MKPSPGAVALKALLEKRGAQSAMARTLGISGGYLSDILRGAKHASGTLAFRIEDATGIPARLFLRRAA